MRQVKLTGALLLCLSFGTDAGEPLKPLSFLAEARVEVDAGGKLVKVEASEDLPDAVRDYIEQQVATWTFIPRHREGTTGNATTWVSLGACAVPKDDGTYSMGLAMHGFGPRIAGGGKWGLSQDLLVAVSRAGYAGSADVHFIVHADGSAEVSSIDGLSNKRVEKAVKRWLESKHFDPETIGGQAVATRETLPMAFRVAGPREDVHATALANAMTSPQCRQAGLIADGMRGVAIDSVMSIEPSI